MDTSYKNFPDDHEDWDIKIVRKRLKNFDEKQAIRHEEMLAKFDIIARS